MHILPLVGFVLSRETSLAQCKDMVHPRQHGTAVVFSSFNVPGKLSYSVGTVIEHSFEDIITEQQSASKNACNTYA